MGKVYPDKSLTGSHFAFNEIVLRRVTKLLAFSLIPGTPRLVDMRLAFYEVHRLVSSFRASMFCVSSVSVYNSYYANFLIRT